MLIDQTKLHTKTILTIDGPMKQFPTKDGIRERFDILFTDRYKAEFCPLVATVRDLPKSGQEIHFKVKHRGVKGDEIELAIEEARPGVLNETTSRVFNINGHPAITALNGAVKLHEIKSKDKKDLMASDILEDAEVLYEWLLIKANGG